MLFKTLAGVSELHLFSYSSFNGFGVGVRLAKRATVARHNNYVIRFQFNVWFLSFSDLMQIHMYPFPLCINCRSAKDKYLTYIRAKCGSLRQDHRLLQGYAFL